MNILKLYSDFNIPHTTEKSGPRWVETKCPFCDDPSAHLGYSLDKDYFNCWRCGWKATDKAVGRLTGVSVVEAQRLIKLYKSAGSSSLQAIVKIRRRAFKLPSNVGPLQISHRLYLHRRKFDPYELERKWDLLSTSPTSFLDKIDYRHSILIPIYWKGKMVSFQCRDVTGKNPSRYKACPKERELIHHKDVLYLHPSHQHKHEIGICVEGATDVWRLGPIAFATLGTSVTTKQIQLIKQLFKRIALIFDAGDVAQSKAKRLQSELHFAGIPAKIIQIKGDPADLSQEEADQLIKELIK